MNSFFRTKKIYIIESAFFFIYIGILAFLHFYPYLFSHYDALKKGTFYLLTAFLFTNYLIYYRTLKESQKRDFIIIIILTLLSSLPLFFRGINMNGHDIKFHMYRIEGIVQEIKTLHIPARLYSLWCNGYGYPTPIYYGDYFLYFPAILRILGFSITSSFKIFIFVINAITSISSMLCFTKIYKDQKIACILSFAFCLTPYRLTNLYVRHSVGEYCAMIFYPFIAFAFIRIYRSSNNNIKEILHDGTLLGIGMTGLLITHILSTEVIVFTIILLFLFLIKKSMQSKIILSFLCAIIITVLLSAAFLVPFLDYFVNVPIVSSANVSEGLMIQDRGISIAELFTFFAADPESNVQLTPGILLILVQAVGIYVTIKKSSKLEIKILTTISFLFLFMTLYIFPWDLIAKIRFLNILTQIQYPWRYLGPASITLTLLLGYLLKDSLTEELLYKYFRHNITPCCMLLSVFSILIFVSLFAFNPSLIYYETEETFFPESTYEYARIKWTSDNYYRTNFENYDGKIEGSYENAEIISSKGLNMKIYFKNTSKNTVVSLPRTNYPGYKIYDDYNNSYEIFDSENLTVAFNLPANFDGYIYLYYKTPWYWNAAILVSFITLILLYYNNLIFTNAVSKR